MISFSSALSGTHQMLEQARQEADALLEQDPELEGQPLLKAKVQKLFSQYGEGSFN